MEMVRMAVPGLVPLMLTGVFEPKRKVGRSWAPAGLEVTVAVSPTLPVKPPAGVKVMVEVFPVVAPGATVTAVPETVNPLRLIESGTEGEVSPLLALIASLYVP